MTADLSKINSSQKNIKKIEREMKFCDKNDIQLFTVYPLYYCIVDDR